MNDCSGCVSYGSICRGDQSTLNIKCPCGNCLVKVTCKDGCEEYASFREYIAKRNMAYQNVGVWKRK